MPPFRPSFFTHTHALSRTLSLYLSCVVQLRERVLVRAKREGKEDKGRVCQDGQIVGQRGMTCSCSHWLIAVDLFHTRIFYREANGEGNPCPFVLAALTTASVSTCADLTAWWEEEGSSSARQGLCTVYGTVQ